LKKALHLILILSLFISCKNKLNIQPKYSDFETDLEARNLFGKVKEFSQFRANIKGSDKNQTEKQIIKLKESFNKNGFAKSSEYFDTFGITQQTTENFYDVNNYLQKSITIGQNFPKKMVELIERDTIKKTAFRKIVINDSLNYQFQSTLGKLDRIEKQTRIENGDTTQINYNYKLDSNENVIFVEEIGGKEKNINEYKYDENGNVVESINGTDFFKIKTVTNYKDNRIIKVENYTISADLKQHLESITEFDNYYNPINEKTYQNSELNRETKNEYEFDNNGNWIKKTVYLKEHFANSKKFIPIYIESREIEYWK
tara:strand:+ start:2951 stop:3895 length:945 start_codon:yes stop_codon:yes gene_type:complete